MTVSEEKLYITCKQNSSDLPGKHVLSQNQDLTSRNCTECANCSDHCSPSHAVKRHGAMPRSHTPTNTTATLSNLDPDLTFEYKTANQKKKNKVQPFKATCIFYASFRFIFYCGNILTIFYNHSIILRKCYWLLCF
jgi:hypothetical protein